MASSTASGKGKKASEPTTAPLRSQLRLLDRQACRVDAAHLPGADADGDQILGHHDRVGLDVLRDAEGEEEIAPLLLGRVSTGRDRIASRSSSLDVLVLHEDAAEHALVVELAGVGLASLLGLQDADVRLAFEHLERVGSYPGAKQHLDEELLEALGESAGRRGG